MTTQKEYGREWFEDLHRKNGWILDRFGAVTGWRKPENAASGTRFPFATCVNDQDEHTPKVYSDVCPSYYDALALAHATLDRLFEADKHVRALAIAGLTSPDPGDLFRFLLRCCNFNAVFAAPPAEQAAWGTPDQQAQLGIYVLPEHAKAEIWLVNPSSDIQQRAYDLCVSLSRNPGGSFLAGLQTCLADTSDASHFKGALYFVDKALRHTALRSSEVAGVLSDLGRRKATLPHGCTSILESCLQSLEST